jgi:hypothetical protein
MSRNKGVCHYDNDDVSSSQAESSSDNEYGDNLKNIQYFPPSSDDEYGDNLKHIQYFPPSSDDDKTLTELMMRQDQNAKDSSEESEDDEEPQQKSKTIAEYSKSELQQKKQPYARNAKTGYSTKNIAKYSSSSSGSEESEDKE